MPAVSIWTARVWREFHARNLTPADRDVLLTLQTYRGHGGLICPSHATLADRARRCVRTVQRALQIGQGLGLVSWTERRVRAAWRWLRTSNSYRLDLPDAPVRAGNRPPWPRRATTGQFCGGEEREENKKAREGRKAAMAALLASAARLPDLLTARREAQDRTMRAEWAARQPGRGG